MAVTTQRVGLRIGARVVSSAASGPTVDDMLALTPGLLLDPSDFGNLYQDVARTTPVTADSDPVGSSSDLSGNNRHLSVFGGTASRRPLASDGGVQFDATNDCLINNWGTVAQPLSITLSFKYGAVANSKVLVATGSLAVGFTSYCWINSSGNFAYFADNNVTILAPADTNEHVMTLEYNGASSNVFLDGVQVVTNQNVGNDGTSGLVLGANAIGSANANVLIRRLFLKGAILSTADRQLVESWVDVKGII